MLYLAKAERSGVPGAMPAVHLEDPADGQSLCGILVHRLDRLSFVNVEVCPRCIAELVKREGARTNPTPSAPLP